MATNRATKLLKALNDAVYIAMNPEEWNGAVGFFVDGSFTDTFGQLNNGIPIVPTPTYNGTEVLALQIAGTSPDWGGNKLAGFDPTSALVKWVTIYFTQQDSNAAANSLTCDTNNHACYAEFVGALAARVIVTSAGNSLGVKVTIAAGRA